MRKIIDECNHFLIVELNGLQQKNRRTVLLNVLEVNLFISSLDAGLNIYIKLNISALFSNMKSQTFDKIKFRSITTHLYTSYPQTVPA